MSKRKTQKSFYQKNIPASIPPMTKDQQKNRQTFPQTLYFVFLTVLQSEEKKQEYPLMTEKKENFFLLNFKSVLGRVDFKLLFSSRMQEGSLGTFSLAVFPLRLPANFRTRN